MSLQIVVGGQFGSEAKGAVTAAIANHARERDRRTVVVRTGGPNAGHSAADQEGKVWALRQVPAGMVVDSQVEGVIASGSEIDPEVLFSEIEMLEAGGHEIAHRLTISESATVITERHRQQEAELVGRIGSTGKGIGGARADRIMRSAPLVRDTKGLFDLQIETAELLEVDLNEAVRADGTTVVIEGTQGYGLGLHTQYYPQVTSGDCRAIDVCAQAGINPWGSDFAMRVHVVVRPYPIRVAGNSGPLEGETSWEELGLPQELTTVTKKVRRVGHYDASLVQHAITANSPYAVIALSMVDQIEGAVNPDGFLTQEGTAFVRGVSELHDTPVVWLGVGPTIGDWFRW